MIRSLAIAAALALTAVAAPAMAQTPAPAAAQPAPKFTVDTTMAEISADPQAKVVLGDFFEKRRIAAGAPAMTPEESAGLAEMIGGLSPRQLAEFPQANLDDAALAELDALLRAVPAHANH
ncbi:hypothetical protein QOZ96_002597 [Brevundimonas nasdae]|uniref:hypothetical protein n=1 Tax=Brevundimonas nasdae TaxID=172043 RepID=UPI0019141580|nr:hypothetical protein [Brevundimonas nasdae]MBK6025908.1 hypothetical protein [Brevundimonas nasdae]MDQ0452644.1 hypothetical protein [Brevundimonas nasdae]